MALLILFSYVSLYNYAAYTMSAILSADTLNDYISPSLECIKPIETLPRSGSHVIDNPYEVTTEDKLLLDVPPAQISLTDCLACSGCVTSAEAVLVSLQSHAEVLNALDSGVAFTPNEIFSIAARGQGPRDNDRSKKIFVASVSPQVRASLAATYGVKEHEARHMIQQLFCGPQGLSIGGKYGNRFAWTVDTNAMRGVCLAAGSEEVLRPTPERSVEPPILASICPGWVCYVEKTHPHVIPHLSKLKSPQALTGTLLKTVLSTKLNIDPSQIFHLAIMPCFDKKLEGSRQELTNKYWQPEMESDDSSTVRDVDCVITAREVLMLADGRGISFPALPRTPLAESDLPTFPDELINRFIFTQSLVDRGKQSPEAGTSGGFLYHILQESQDQNPGSVIQRQCGRNPDVVDYTITLQDEVIFRASRYYGFRNIQNLVRKLKPPKISRLSGKTIGAKRPGLNTSTTPQASYVEVMACPGGCTNGGGQIKFDDLGVLQSPVTTIENAKEWLNLVDEAYYSMEEQDHDPKTMTTGEEHSNNEKHDIIGPQTLIDHWSAVTHIPADKLLRTTFREVHSDVGKPKKKFDVDRVAEIATKLGGGW